jgi:hypothetical protein
MLHKTADVSITSDYFSSFPEQITFDSTGTVIVSVSGTGLVKGTTGRRWWDSAVLSPGSISGSPGSIVVFPFTKQFFAPYYLDLIATVTVDGVPYVYGTSNHPDNVVSTVSSTNVDLYYLDLYSMGLGVLNGAIAVLGNNNANNHFMQGGDPKTGNDTSIASVRFPVSAAISGTLSISATYYAYDGTAPISTFTKSVAYTAGATSVACLSPLELYNHYNNNFNYKTPWRAGFYKIVVASNNPSARSLLKAYHWGIG